MIGKISIQLLNYSVLSDSDWLLFGILVFLGVGQSGLHVLWRLIETGGSSIKIMKHGPQRCWGL